MCIYITPKNILRFTVYSVTNVNVHKSILTIFSPSHHFVCLMVSLSEKSMNGVIFHKNSAIREAEGRDYTQRKRFVMFYNSHSASASTLFLKLCVKVGFSHKQY